MVKNIENININIWELVTCHYNSDNILAIDGDLYLVDHSVSRLEEGDTFIGCRIKFNMELTESKYIINRTAHSNMELTYKVAYQI